MATKAKEEVDTRIWRVKGDEVFILFRSFHYGSFPCQALDPYTGRIWDSYEDVDPLKEAGLSEKKIEEIFFRKVEQYGGAGLFIPDPFNLPYDAQVRYQIYELGDLYFLKVP